MDPLSGDPSWSLGIPGFSVLIIPLLLINRFKQVSVLLSRFAFSVPTGRNPSAELFYLGLRYHSHSFQSSPLSPPPSHWLVLQSSGHSQAPWAWVYPMAGPTHRAVPLISIPFPNQAQLYSAPTGELLKNIHSSNPLSPQLFDHCISYLKSKKKKKKKETMPFAATWMALEIFILREVSQTEKDNYHMISLTCGI